MSKYIIGYTIQEYLVGGTLIPKKVYTSEEKARGKSEILEISEEDLEILRTNKIFKTLEVTKKIRILDNKPSWAVSGTDREAALQARIKELEGKKSGTLEKDLAAAKAETESIKTEAQTIIDELRAENAALKKG